MGRWNKERTTKKKWTNEQEMNRDHGLQLVSQLQISFLPEKGMANGFWSRQASMRLVDEQARDQIEELVILSAEEKKKDGGMSAPSQRCRSIDHSRLTVGPPTCSKSEGLPLSASLPPPSAARVRFSRTGPPASIDMRDRKFRAPGLRSFCAMERSDRYSRNVKYFRMWSYPKKKKVRCSPSACNFQAASRPSCGASNLVAGGKAGEFAVPLLRKALVPLGRIADEGLGRIAQHFHHFEHLGHKRGRAREDNQCFITHERLLGGKKKEYKPVPSRCGR